MSVNVPVVHEAAAGGLSVSSAPRFDVVPMTPFGVRVQAHGPSEDLRGIPVAELRALVRKHHLVLLRGFAPLGSAESLSRYCTTWGDIMKWSFGDVLELVEHENPTDHIFDNSYVPFHWDGMYMPLIPALQVFQCVHAPGMEEGGQTTFTDTTRILANASPEQRALWEKVTVTYRIKKVAHYGGQAVSPLITAHPEEGYPVLRYNEPPREDVRFLNRPEIEFGGIAAEQVEALKQGLHEALYSPQNYYGHDWQTGDVLVADNYVLLHGRAAFTSRSPRHLRRVHILGTPPFRNPAVG